MCRNNNCHYFTEPACARLQAISSDSQNNPMMGKPRPKSLLFVQGQMGTNLTQDFDSKGHPLTTVCTAPPLRKTIIQEFHHSKVTTIDT